MSLFVPIRQASIRIPDTGPAHDPERGHLFVVLTNRCSEGKHLLVPVCSVRKRHDTTCLLGKGDHKSIHVPSFVSYSHAATYDAKVLADRVSNGDFTYKGPFDEKVFALICVGLINSPMTPLAMKKYYEANA